MSTLLVDQKSGLLQTGYGGVNLDCGVGDREVLVTRITAEDSSGVVNVRHQPGWRNHMIWTCFEDLYLMD
jgi:hypothetical protein